MRAPIPVSHSASSTTAEPLPPEVVVELARVIARTTCMDRKVAAARIDVAESTFQKLLDEGEIESVWVTPRRRVVTLAALDDFVTRRQGGASDAA